MANSVTVKISGIEELEKNLYDLPSKFAKRAVRSALKAGAGIWKEGLESSAPVRTGFLKEQADISIKLSAKEESGTALVGFTKKQNPSRQEKEKSVPSAGNEAFWYEMGTVNQPARPFIRPLFESSKGAVLDVFVAKLKEAFAEVFGS